jgi:hypothetical protein
MQAGFAGDVLADDLGDRFSGGNRNAKGPNVTAALD